MRKKSNLIFSKVIQTKIRGILKWFSIGIGIKRWIGLAVIAGSLIVYGSIRFRIDDYPIYNVLDAVIVVCSIIIFILSIKRLMRAFLAAVVPSSRDIGLVDILYQRKQL